MSIFGKLFHNEDKARIRRLNDEVERLKSLNSKLRYRVSELENDRIIRELLTDIDPVETPLTKLARDRLGGRS